MGGAEDEATLDENVLLQALDYVKSFEKDEKKNVNVIILPSKKITVNEELNERLREMSNSRVILSSKGN